jgi:hypothetical protein
VSLQSLAEAGLKLRSEHLRARERWSDGGEGSTVTDHQRGVDIVIHYEGSSRTSDFRSVHLDGHLFARETETTPWNIFKPITVGYTVYLNLSLETALNLVAQVKTPVGKITLQEEWYPAENGPMRYFAHCTEFDDVISLWKVWKPTFLDRFTKHEC